MEIAKIMKTNKQCPEMKKYESKLSEFLIQRIDDAGGSLQIQHLSGLMHQLEFEIKDAFEITKSNLMIYLRAHSNLFEINQKGIITLKKIECNNNNIDESLSVGTKEIVPSYINNGSGIIFQIFSGFAIIQARKPFKTYVFFTPKEYGGCKDKLFLDSDINLQVKSKVCFNAIHGHNDYEIKYRATRVWETSNFEDECKIKDECKTLTGTGFIQKCCSEFGFISVSGQKNETVIFYRRDVKDDVQSLEEIFTTGDEVKFVAEKELKEDKSLWRAKEISKLKKKKNQPRSAEVRTIPTEESNRMPEKKKANIKENELGKISPCQNGAVIKFGKNFSELADGKSADYYLYGCKVCDIAFEFSDGDEVRFDAIKSKDHCGWKAVLVWVGDKPETKGIKEYKDCEENTKNFSHTSSKNVLPKVTDSLSKLRTKKTMSKCHNVKYKKKNDVEQKEETVYVHSFNKKSDRSPNKYCKDKSRTSKMGVKKNSKKFDRDFNDDVHFRANGEDKGIPKSSRDTFENFNTSHVSSESDETFSDEDISESSSSSSDEESLTNKYLKSDLNDTDEKHTSLINETSDSKVASNNLIKPSIKKFENLSGTVCRVHCKVAIIKSSQIQENVNCVLSEFYFEGQPVEELQVEDLREVIGSGDKVNFNYFEIIDDNGEIHRKVTSAWIGPKPEVHEKSPEEFIAEQELSVSIDSKSHIKQTPEENYSTVDKNSSSESLEYYSETESYFETLNTDAQSEHSVVVETAEPKESKRDDLLVKDRLCDSDDNDYSKVDDLSGIKDGLRNVETSDYLKVDNLSAIYDESKNSALSVYPRNNDLSPDIQYESEDNSSEDAQCTLMDDLSLPEKHRSLFNRVVEKLKMYDGISIDSEGKSVICNIINLVLKDYVYKLHNETLNQHSSSVQSSSLSCSCSKSDKQTSSGQGDKATTISAEIQTIVTGEILAARDDLL